MYSIQYIFKKILFPQHCIVCKRNDPLCDSCAQSLIGIPHIHREKKYTEITLLPYKNRNVSNIIWELKYKNNQALRKKIVLATRTILNKELSLILPQQTNHVHCISVPKNKTDTLKQRDFDHGLLLTKEYAKQLPYNVSILTGYLSKETTHRQVEHTKRRDRIHHIKNSITQTEKMKNVPKTNIPLIIIDDVTTTGATRDEMIRVMHYTYTGTIVFIALAH